MKILEVSVNYNICKLNSTCHMNFTIPENMTAPIFLFYEIDNFYQNHRRYVRSKSLKQLAGDDLTEDELSKNCDPIMHVRDLQAKFRTNKQGITLDDNLAANPCGLIANSFFDGLEFFSLKIRSFSL